VTRQRNAIRLAAALLFAAAPAAAEVELTPHASLLTSSAVSTRQGDLGLDPGAALGLVVGWHIRPDGMIEIAYTREEATLELESLPLFDVTLDAVLASGVWEIRTGPTRPFLGIGFGAARIEPDFGGVDSEWLFSAGIHGGVKRYFGQRFGLRIEGRGLVHLTSSGGGFLCGSSGGGASCAAELDGDGFFQLQALVGLVIRL
jgi:hypothetical protein